MKQNFEIKNDRIREQFLQYKKEHPEKLKSRLKFSWSNWGFGLEDFEVSCDRLNRAGISYIELHGNHYGADLGYRPSEVRKTMEAYGIQVGGVCGMFSADNDLSSNRPGRSIGRQPSTISNGKLLLRQKWEENICWYVRRQWGAVKNTITASWKEVLTAFPE